jgi:hypothetical protein
MRGRTALMFAIALAALAAAGAAEPAKAPPLRGSVRVLFAGQAQERVERYKEWILQVEQECYYDATIENAASFSWTASWGPLPLKRLRRPAAVAASGRSEGAGTVSGAEVRGDCGNAEAPPDWLATIPCAESLRLADPALLETRAAGGRTVLRLQAPRVSLQRPSACGLNPRNDQLYAEVAVDPQAVARLRKGAKLVFRVGTGTKSGTYVPEQNCQFQPAPYEGYFITDECRDTLVWSGTVTLVKA